MKVNQKEKHMPKLISHFKNLEPHFNEQLNKNKSKLKNIWPNL